MSKSNIAIIWAHIYAQYVLRCGFKNGHQKGNMCLREIGLCAQNKLIVLGAMVNMNSGGRDII